MNYFCKVKVTAKKDAVQLLYFILDETKSGVVPEFTQKMLYENATYQSFIRHNRTKVYPTQYEVYSTEETVTANLQDEEFENLINNSQSKRCSSGEFNMSFKLEVHKKKNSPIKNIIIAVSSVIVVCALVYGAFRFGSILTEERLLAVPEPVVIAEEDMIDGMKILNQNDEEMSEESEQITISLDRSYSAVPKEDIQLKGILVDGVAEVTLPEFDREDFFSHIPGYTYGFSTIKDSDRIEYYGGQTYKFETDTKLYRVLVKYGGGHGTKEDPYIINYYDQLELMAEEKARGYFKQTCDIEFPDWATHNSIDTINELKSEPDKERFEFDGGGYTIMNIDKPLFGKVSGALITNVNIRNANIVSSEYKYYGVICCESYNYQYKGSDSKNYETGETVIKNCSVSDSSINIEYPEDENSYVVVTVHEPEIPDRIEYDANGQLVTTTAAQSPPITLNGDFAIGGITGIGGQIEDCLVKKLSVSCYIDKYFLFSGGISGKPANVINSLVSDYKVNGKIFTCGGIAGSAGGSRKYNALGETLPDYYGGNIQGCAAINLELNSEFAAGGITGEATSAANDMLISNCYAYNASVNSGTRDSGYIKKSGYNGGVIGYDGQEMNGHTVINCVAPTEYNFIGSALKTKGDDTVRLAPAFAYHQETILNVLNNNSINKNNPSEIFTGIYKIDGLLSDDGVLAYPETIAKLFDKVEVLKNEEEN